MVRKSTGGRKLFNVQKIMIILKYLTTILRIMQVVRRLITFLQLCVVNLAHDTYAKDLDLRSVSGGF